MADISQSLVEQVQKAHAARQPLAIAGNGSKAFMGRTATGSPLSVAQHTGVVRYEPTELVITVRAGTTLSEIQHVLAAERQCLGIESPDFDGRATLGGTLACNLSGPARPWKGSIRDHVLGLRLINGRGEHMAFGGQVIKNVAGYDVSRLQAGAMGVLGVITELSLRVFPLPEHSATVVAEMDYPSAAKALIKHSTRSSSLSAACWSNQRIYVRHCGIESVVRREAADFGGDTLSETNPFWADLREQRNNFFSDQQSLWRFSVKSAAPHFLPDAAWLIDWGGSQRWLIHEGEFKQMEQYATSAQGQVSLYRGGDRKQEVFHSRTEIQQQLHRKIKQAFDPLAIFNPGRLYSWL